MDIVLFQDITTNMNLEMLERNGKKYTGLYVDMDNDEERKYVKDCASLVSGMLKQLDRSRIDKTKAGKALIDAEAKSIHDRLVVANKPFMTLIDEHKEKRKLILAAEKAAEAAIEMIKLKASDHELAINEDKARAFEVIEQERAQAERDADVVAKAVDHLASLAEANKLKRESDIDHKTQINNSALFAVMGSAGITEKQAKAVIVAIAKGQIPNVTINY